MSFRDFMLLFGCCLVWGLNLVLTRWVVADLNIPPLFFAAIRFAGVALFLIPFLRPDLAVRRMIGIWEVRSSFRISAVSS